MSKAKSGKSEMKNYRFCHEMEFVMYCQKLRVAKVRCQILEWHKQSGQKPEWQKQSFPFFLLRCHAVISVTKRLNTTNYWSFHQLKHQHPGPLHWKTVQKCRPCSLPVLCPLLIHVTFLEQM